MKLQLEQLEIGEIYRCRLTRDRVQVTKLIETESDGVTKAEGLRYNRKTGEVEQWLIEFNYELEEL